MDALFDPPAFRYTVRTPESRHAELKKRAARVSMTPGQLVQALFDSIDLTASDGQVGIAKEHFDRLFPRAETTKELTDRAASVGLTARELKVFRALVAAAGPIRIVQPSPSDIASRSGVGESYHDAVYDRLMAKGFIALGLSAGRGRRRFTIARMPEL